MGRIGYEGAALFLDPAEGSVAHKKPLDGFFLFKVQDLAEVRVGQGEKLQIVFDVLPGSEGIFGQKDGKLGLDSQGGTQRFLEQFHPCGGKFRSGDQAQRIESDPVAAGEPAGGEVFQVFQLIFQSPAAPGGIIRTGKAQRGSGILDAILFGKSQRVVKIYGAGEDLLPEKAVCVCLKGLIVLLIEIMAAGAERQPAEQGEKGQKKREKRNLFFASHVSPRNL